MTLKALLMEKNPTYNGSTMCLISSQGFLAAALYQAIVNKNYIICALFVPAWLASTWYHSCGRGRKVDMTISSFFFSVFLLYLWIRGDHLSFALGLLAIIGYFVQENSGSFDTHCLLVHIPSILAIITISPDKK